MGETSMEVPLERKTPDRSAAESTSSELIRLVHKLRWAGMEEEAERLLKKWEHRQARAEESVVATPTETD
jgi:phage shock protein A